jgi:hypothetical protein
MVQRVCTIFPSQIAVAVLKYSRFNRKLVVCLGFLTYSIVHLRTLSYNIAAFSGIDFPDKISSPVNWLRSIWGVFAVDSMYRFFNSTIMASLLSRFLR